MWRSLIVASAAAMALSISAVGNADAQRVGISTHGRAGVGAHMGTGMAGARSGLSARAQARGPAFRPHGWSEGRKVGWHCRVGARGCVPPGLR
jgi:hypothetical protein